MIFVFKTSVKTKKQAKKLKHRKQRRSDKLFNGLSGGGKVEVPIADSSFGSYFGIFADKFGIQWMVDFDTKYNGQT